MIAPSQTATRVDKAWQIFAENGDTVEFRGKRFTTAPKQQTPETIHAAYVALRLAETTGASNHLVTQRKAKQR